MPEVIDETTTRPDDGREPIADTGSLSEHEAEYSSGREPKAPPASVESPEPAATSDDGTREPKAQKRSPSLQQRELPVPHQPYPSARERPAAGSMGNIVTETLWYACVLRSANRPLF